MGCSLKYPWILVPLGFFRKLGIGGEQFVPWILEAMKGSLQDGLMPSFLKEVLGYPLFNGPCVDLDILDRNRNRSV